MTVGPIPHRAAGGPSEESKGAPVVVGVELSERAAQPARRRAERGAAGSAALPCLNSNNSNETLFPPGARKTAFKVGETIRYASQKYGIERLGLFTITFPDGVTAKEASRRFNVLNAGVISARYQDWLAVYERGTKSKLPHFHLIVVLAKDIRTGADFEAFARGDYSSANAALKTEWAFWRSVVNYNGKRWKTARYPDIGRTEIYPIKSTADGIRKYVGKYIEKHMESRLPEDKGVRLLRVSKGLNRMTVNFAWASPRAALFREKLALFAKANGVKDLAGMKERFGPRWAFNLRGQILAQEMSIESGARERSFARENGTEVTTLESVEAFDRSLLAGKIARLMEEDYSLVYAALFQPLFLARCLPIDLSITAPTKAPSSRYAALGHAS